MPAPPKNSHWEFRNRNLWEIDFSISVLPFEHPDSHLREYSGDDNEVKEIFENNNLHGYYEKQNYPENGVQYYVKSNPKQLYIWTRG